MPDSTYFGLRPFEHVTAWVALCNVTKEAGPVEFAVGSHIRGQLLQKSNVVKNSVNTAGQIIVEWFDQSQQDFGVAETQRHEVSFRAYLESFYEQSGIAEKDIPADLAALAP